MNLNNLNQAKSVRHLLIQELKELLKAVSQAVRVVQNVMASRSNIDHEIRNKLNTIQTRITEIIRNKDFKHADFNEISNRMKTVIALFEQIEGEDWLMESVILAETKAVITNAKIKLIISTEAILKHDYGYHKYKVSVSSLNSHLAKTFIEWYPRFLGYRIETYSNYSYGFAIDILGNPPGKGGAFVDALVIDTLKPKVEEFVMWEIRNYLGYDREYDIGTLGNIKKLKTPCTLFLCQDVALMWEDAEDRMTK